MQRHLLLGAMLGAVFLGCSAPAMAGGGVADLVDRFDRATGDGLPAVLSLGDPDDAPHRAARAAPDELVVDRRLNVAVHLPGGEEGHMFAGAFRGQPAVFTRAGDHLDVTVEDGQGAVVTGFTAGDDTIEYVDWPVPADTGDVPVTASAPEENAPPGRRKRTLPESIPMSVPKGHKEDPAAFGLHFFFFLHDDTAAIAPRHVHARFVAWWLDEMASSVLPTERIETSYFIRRPWITDVVYGNGLTLEGFAGAMWMWGDTYGGAYARTFKHKFILLTKRRPEAGVGGQAYEGGSVAVASVSGKSRLVAHELGHTLGAVHEEGGVIRKDWWWCESTMYATRSLLWPDCLAYTASNHRRIRSYMRHGPDATQSPYLFSDP